MSSRDLPYASCGKSGEELKQHLYAETPSYVETGIPPDQWKAEVRQLFETSLAQIQYAVLETVRGRSES